MQCIICEFSLPPGVVTDICEYCSRRWRYPLNYGEVVPACELKPEPEPLLMASDVIRASIEVVA